GTPQRDLGLHLPHPGSAGPGRRRRPGREGARRRHPAPGRRPAPPGEGAGRRVLREAPHLRADGLDHPRRRRAGGHHRTGEHPPLRAPRVRDARHRRPLRPHRPTARPAGPRRHLRRGDAVGPRPRLGALGGGAARGRQGVPVQPPWAHRDRRLVRGRHAARGARPGHRAADRGDGGHEAGRRGPRAARHVPGAADRDRLRAGRRPARGRARGAAGGRAGGADHRAGHRPGRRRARGDGPRRRRRPHRRAGAGAGRDPAGADGARGRQGRAPAAQLRRVHRRRDDDARAPRAAAGRDRGRGAGPGPRRRADPGAGLHGLRLPLAAGDPDRALHRGGALPAAAARTALDAGVVAARQRPGTAHRGGEPARGEPLLRHLQPGQRARHRRRAPPDRRRHRRRRAGPRAARGLARHPAGPAVRRHPPDRRRGEPWPGL
ncbi:MAG: Mg/Co/Ni transporter MgtE, CBS domain-containing, partial [uncultured Friedmanniella sp.]